MKKLTFFRVIISISFLSAHYGWGEQVALTQAPSSGPAFKDVTSIAGVGHRHHGPSVDKRLQNLGPWFTALGAGGAVADYDNDGDEDIYVTDSLKGHGNVLYRNDGNLTFTEVAKQAGIADLNDDKHFSSMAIFFDCNNDGYKDLVVGRFGQSALFQNNGDGTFSEITRLSKFPVERNTVALNAFDYDRDGDLDLYMGNYFPDVDLTSVRTTKLLHDSWESARNGGTNTLMANDGKCRFSDKTIETGLGDTGWTLAIGAGDFDKDGWSDLYIANDFGPDKLYRNNGKGSFTDVSEKSFGVDTKKGMNAEVADYDNDGWPDIYVTNITEPFLNECNMLWRNNGDFTFTDVSMATKTCDTDWGWAGKFIDYDNDGWQDLYVLNGFISGGVGDYIDTLMPIILDSEVDLSDTMSWPPLGNMSFSGNEKNRLFKNRGNHVFDEVAEANSVNSARDGRGLIIADFDQDGGQDMYVLNSNADAILYKNLIGHNRNWIEIRLEGKKSNRDAIGTKATFYAKTGLYYRETNAGNGYQGQSSSYLHVGLDSAKIISRIVIEWPSGEKQEFTDVTSSVRYKLIEGGKLERLEKGVPANRESKLPSRGLDSKPVAGSE